MIEIRIDSNKMELKLSGDSAMIMLELEEMVDAVIKAISKEAGADRIELRNAFFEHMQSKDTPIHSMN